MPLGTVELHGEEALRMAEAIASETRFKILQVLSTERLDVSTIAKRLQVSEAYASGEITLLENLGIIKASYERGKRGIRKVCQLVIGRIVINLEQEQTSGV